MTYILVYYNVKIERRIKHYNYKYVMMIKGIVYLEAKKNKFL